MSCDEEVAILVYTFILNKHPFAQEATQQLEALTDTACTDPVMRDSGGLAKDLYDQFADASSSTEKLAIVNNYAQNLFNKVEEAYKACIKHCMNDLDEKVILYEREVLPCLKAGLILGNAPTSTALAIKIKDEKQRIRAIRYNFGSDIIDEQWEPYFDKYKNSIESLTGLVKDIQGWRKQCDDYKAERRRLKLQKMAIGIAGIAVTVSILGWIQPLRDQVAYGAQWIVSLITPSSCSSVTTR